MNTLLYVNQANRTVSMVECRYDADKGYYVNVAGKYVGNLNDTLFEDKATALDKLNRDFKYFKCCFNDVLDTTPNLYAMSSMSDLLAMSLTVQALDFQ